MSAKHTTEPLDADVRLYAAAPDLLCAAKAFVEGVKCVCGTNNDEAAFLERMEDQFRAAIAKATGE